MLEKRFDVRLDPDALKEYGKLDNSVLPAVNKAIDELEYRADEVGKPLGNKSSTKLAGCKEIKLREEGIRYVGAQLLNDLVHHFHTAMSHDNAEESANESSVFFCLLRASLNS